MEDPMKRSENDLQQGEDIDGLDSLSEPLTEEPDMEALVSRMKEIEEEAQLIRRMQTDVERQINTTTAVNNNPAQNTASWEEKMEVDSRSAYVGNVDYTATAEELETHFRGCGSVNRVTILTDKFSGHPKGYAYIEFADRESLQMALALDESLFHGRQIKVCAKRTNRPGLAAGRGRRARGTRVVVRYIYGGRGARSRYPRRRSSAYVPTYG